MLYERIKADIMEAARAKDSARANLLRTLVGDAVTLARAKEIRDPADDEMIRLVRKFVANAELTAETCERAGRDASGAKAEIAILSGYLPATVSEDDMRAVLETLKTEGALPAGPAGTGAAMKALKERFGDRFDGKRANPVVKAFLAS
jgi:hypothetical protein